MSASAPPAGVSPVAISKFLSDRSGKNAAYRRLLRLDIGYVPHLGRIST
jgi:hypothetical protein